MIVQEIIASLFLAEIFEGIGPQDVTHEALGGRFSEAINLQQLLAKYYDSSMMVSCLEIPYVSDVIESVEFRTETTMNTQELLVHDCSQGQAAERLHTCVIYGLRVLVLAFKLKREVVSQVATFVVTSEQPQRVGVMDLERPEVQHTFDTEIATVDVVSQKKISGLGGVATDLEKLHKIVVLAVNITTNGDRSVHLQKIAFSTKNLSTLAQNEQSLFFGQTPFAVKMLLEKVDVGHGLGVICVELLVGRLGHGWRLNVLANSLHSANLSSVFHGMNCEVDLWQRLLLLDSANRIVDLLVSTLRHNARIAFSVHVERRGVSGLEDKQKSDVWVGGSKKSVLLAPYS